MRRALCEKTEFLPSGLIGFSGADPVSDLVNLVTWGIPRWGLSHIAIVAPHVETRLPILIESTTLCDLDCLYTGKRANGVQAHRIEDRVGPYSGRVWYYPPAARLTRHAATALACWCYSHRGRPYDYSGAFHARDLCCGWLARLYFPNDPDAFFCSEFVPAAMRMAGMFGRRAAGLFDRSVNVWSPNRFSRFCVRHGTHLRPVRLK